MNQTNLLAFELAVKPQSFEHTQSLRLNLRQYGLRADIQKGGLPT